MKRTAMILAMAMMLMLSMVATTAQAATFTIDTTVPAGGMKDICSLVGIPGGQEIRWNLSFDHEITGKIAVCPTNGGTYRQEFSGASVQGSYTPTAREDSYQILFSNYSNEDVHVTGTVVLPDY